MSYIPNLPGICGFQFIGPILPNAYTDFYTQEDRLKELAKMVQRQAKWGEAALIKINDVVDAINNSSDVDVSDLVIRMNQIEVLIAELSVSIDSQFTLVNGEIDDVSTDVDALTVKVNSNSTAINAINTKITALTTAADALKLRVDAHDVLIAGNTSSIASVVSDVSGVRTDLTALEGEVSMVAPEAATALQIAQATKSEQDTIKNKSFLKTSKIGATTTAGKVELNVQASSDKISGESSEDTKTSVPFTSSDSTVAISVVDVNGTPGLDFKVDIPSGGGDVSRVEFESLKGRVGETEDSIATLDGSISDLNSKTSLHDVELINLDARVDALEANPGGGGDVTQEELDAVVSIIEINRLAAEADSSAARDAANEAADKADLASDAVVDLANDLSIANENIELNTSTISTVASDLSYYSLSTEQLLEVKTIVGQGRPDVLSVVAGVGRVYVDTNETDGAIQWIMTADGWKVSIGDTGWFNVQNSTSADEGSIFNSDWAGKLHARVVNSTVNLRAQELINSREGTPDFTPIDFSKFPSLIMGSNEDPEGMIVPVYPDFSQDHDRVYYLRNDGEELSLSGITSVAIGVKGMFDCFYTLKGAWPTLSSFPIPLV